MPPPLPEPERRVPPPPETPEESPNFFDERFDFEEPFDLLESSEPPAATAETAGETTEPAEKRPRRRRRRRRRGRGDEQRESAAAGTDVGERSGDSTSASAEDSPRESEAELREPIGPQQVRDQSEAGKSREQRSQRHPPRRGRDRRDTGAGAAEERPRDRDRAAPPKLPADDEADVDVFAGDELELGEGDQSEGEQPARLGFRGIPTWEEVLGMLIDKNLEARSRRSAGGPHHGRGNRGPATTAAIATAATNGDRNDATHQRTHRRTVLGTGRKARQMSPEDKLLGGARLFDRSCRIMADGIRSQFPDADEHRVQEILRERLAMIRQRENRQ